MRLPALLLCLIIPAAYAQDDPLSASRLADAFRKGYPADSEAVTTDGGKIVVSEQSVANARHLWNDVSPSPDPFPRSLPRMTIPSVLSTEIMDLAYAALAKIAPGIGRMIDRTSWIGSLYLTIQERYDPKKDTYDITDLFEEASCLAKQKLDDYVRWKEPFPPKKNELIDRALDGNDDARWEVSWGTSEAAAFACREIFERAASDDGEAVRFWNKIADHRDQPVRCFETILKDFDFPAIADGARRGDEVALRKAILFERFLPRGSSDLFGNQDPVVFVDAAWSFPPNWRTFENRVWYWGSDFERPSRQILSLKTVTNDLFGLLTEKKEILRRTLPWMVKREFPFEVGELLRRRPYETARVLREIGTERGRLYLEANALGITWFNRFTPEGLREMIGKRNGAKRDGEKPLLLMIADGSDWNGFVDQEVAQGFRLFGGRYDIIYYEAVGRKGLVNSGVDTGTFLGGADAIDFVVHSQKEHSDYMTLEDEGFLKESGIRDALKEGGQIVIDGCASGADGKEGKNLVNMMRRIFPQARPNGIFGATKNSFLRDVKFDANGIDRVEFSDGETYWAQRN
ncbi:MAG: hypothetical protein V1495_07005 [Pseudomonadota bacterium]